MHVFDIMKVVRRWIRWLLPALSLLVHGVAAIALSPVCPVGISPGLVGYSFAESRVGKNQLINTCRACSS